MCFKVKIFDEIDSVKVGFFPVKKGRECLMVSGFEKSEGYYNTNKEKVSKLLVPDFSGAVVSMKQGLNGKSYLLENLGEFEKIKEVQYNSVFTKLKNISLVGRSSDCAVILLYDNTNGVAGYIHAGFPNTMDGIFESSFESFEKLGGDVSKVVCAVSPLLGFGNYEAMEDMIERVVAYDSSFKKFFTPKQDKANCYDFNYRGLVLAILENKGVLSENIEFVDVCTYEHPDFSSHRKNIHSGRSLLDGYKPENQASVITIL